MKSSSLGTHVQCGLGGTASYPNVVRGKGGRISTGTEQRDEETAEENRKGRINAAASGLFSFLPAFSQTRFSVNGVALKLPDQTSGWPWRTNANPNTSKKSGLPGIWGNARDDAYFFLERTFDPLHDDNFSAQRCNSSFNSHDSSQAVAVFWGLRNCTETLALVRATCAMPT